MKWLAPHSSENDVSTRPVPGIADGPVGNNDKFLMTKAVINLRTLSNAETKPAPIPIRAVAFARKHRISKAKFSIRLAIIPTFDVSCEPQYLVVIIVVVVSEFAGNRVIHRRHPEDDVVAKWTFDKVDDFYAPDPSHHEHTRHHQRCAPKFPSPIVKEYAYEERFPRSRRAIVSFSARSLFLSSIRDYQNHGEQCEWCDEQPQTMIRLTAFGTSFYQSPKPEK